MKREQKYPDTKCFHYYNANPKNRITADCVTRAIATALNLDYCTVVMEMAKMTCETGYSSLENKGIDLYLKSKGWEKHKQPRRLDNTKYTGAEWCSFLSENNFWIWGNSMICNIGGNHIVAIRKCDKEFKIHDIWNSSNKCIGVFWTKANIFEK